MSWSGEHLFVVAYDIADPKRWRRVYRTMQGHGAWLQLSLFQCRLTRRRLAALRGTLSQIIKQGEDHVVFLDLGPADSASLRLESLGKATQVVQRQAIII